MDQNSKNGQKFQNGREDGNSMVARAFKMSKFVRNREIQNIYIAFITTIFAIKV